MKELSIEEKAKRYDKVVKKAESLYKAAEPMSGCNVLLETVFPELKESEDESIRKEIIAVFKGQIPFTSEENGKKYIAWLEKQGEKEFVTCPICGWEIEKQGEQNPADIRTTGYWHVEDVEQKPAWSEADETMATNIIIMLKEGASLHFNKNDIAKGVDWLKTLKDRVQPKQEWSVDDERTYRSVLYDFEHHFPLNCVQQEFVKSHIQPQNRWKPSDEQMNAFDAVLVYNPPFSNECRNNLITLYNDLKKLMEE